ncbi:hypothetical protein [Brevundimonas lutea]|uniref:hypothetical protein n=1 Tax=Brevundimonas lutea TaxID=2293980 RepID=UPI000F01A135|nr:hypothetical protein [Brevundimonas lutea]
MPSPSPLSVPTPAARKNALQTAPEVARQFAPFRGGYIDAPVVEVPHTALLYRAANGRIVAELAQRASTQPETSPPIDEANEATQRLLHQLLIKKAGDPTASIIDELARHAQQTEPLLIDTKGVVVNGNRRLAAMRELLARDPERFAGFSTIRAARLPADATPADLEAIEAALQMAPDIKLAYGWINRRLKLSHQLTVMGLSREAVTDAYRFTDPARIDAELDELAVVEAYLAWRGQPAQYDQAADLEPLVSALAASTRDLPPRLRDLWRTAGFALIDARKRLPGPLDKLFPFGPPAPSSLPSWALRRYAEERGLMPMEDGERAGPKSALPPDAVLDQLQTRLADADTAQDTGAALYEVLDQLRAEHVENRAPAIALKQLTRARTAVAGLERGRFSDKQLRALRSEMVALQADVSALLEETAPPVAAPLPPAPPKGLWRTLRGKA